MNIGHWLLSLKLYLELLWLLTSWYLPSPADSSLTRRKTVCKTDSPLRCDKIVYISSQWQTLQSHAKKCWPGIYVMLSVGGWWISILLFDAYHSHSWRDLHVRTDNQTVSQPPTSIRDLKHVGSIYFWRLKCKIFYCLMCVMWHGLSVWCCVWELSHHAVLIQKLSEWPIETDLTIHPFLRSWFRLQPTKVANKLRLLPGWTVTREN